MEDEIFVVAVRRLDGRPPSAVKIIGPSPQAGDEGDSESPSLIFHTLEDATRHFRKLPRELRRCLEVRRALVRMDERPIKVEEG